MFDFTKRAKRVINEYAQQEAKRLGHDIIGPEHILLGLLREEDSVAIKILKNLNVNMDELKREVERRSRQGGITLLIDISPNPDKYQKVIDYSKEEAKRLKHNYVGTEHILLALLRNSNNVAGASLSSFSINYSVVKGEILRVLGMVTSGARVAVRQGGSERSRTPTLDEFARDLVQLVREGKLDPVTGRKNEIQRLIQVLCRKTKNNPVLIGEAGVGKTAIAEGLAERIFHHKVPDILFDKRVIALDLASLVAGTKYRGEFEDRLKKIMREIHNSNNIILFIDELHTLIGAGAAEGAIDAANMLKPALARGELQCIGATTLNEFRKYIEKDAALERRFQSIMVHEPSVEDTILILKGLKKSFENHHRVAYSDAALELSVKLSERHINDRCLPDKAIDVIDEAGSRARLANSSRPELIVTLENEIKELVRRKDSMVKSQEYEKAAQIRDDINAKRELLEEKVSQWQERMAENTVNIGVDDIYAIVSLWTGIPLERIEEGEAAKLLRMEKELERRVVGQWSALEQISRAVRRSRTGFKDMKKPSGSFIFLGPTGVGKTELARALAEFLFSDEGKLYRIDMSEYMEPHSVSKLIGSPPGYVGYDDSGQLSEFMRRNPYSVVLFDEIEKAHPDVFNLLLQILDDGQLTDTHGRKIDFSESIIIMTSNLGAREMQKRGVLGFAESDDRRAESRKETLMSELKKYFNPEFLNRIDEVITFSRLSPEDIHQIVIIMVERMNAQFMEKKLKLTLDKNAIDYIAKNGFSEKYGARPLRRSLQREIEDYLALRMLQGAYEKPTELLISVTKKRQTKDKRQQEQKQQAERQSRQKTLKNQKEEKRGGQAVKDVKGVKDIKDAKDAEERLKFTERLWRDYKNICRKREEELNRKHEELSGKNDTQSEKKKKKEPQLSEPARPSRRR